MGGRQSNQQPWGSQFIAPKAPEALEGMEARQELAHLARPEENANIESFYAIRRRDLIDRFTLEGYQNAIRHTELLMLWYNIMRRHRTGKKGAGMGLHACQAVLWDGLDWVVKTG